MSKNEDHKKEIVDSYKKAVNEVNELVGGLESQLDNNDTEAAEAIKKTLAIITEKKDSFAKEVEALSSDCEFEKFTIAFFGETNAGKSTIIEALRIMLDEEGRRNEIDGKVEQYRQERERQRAEIIECLERWKNAYSPKPLWRKLIWPAVMLLIGILTGCVLAWR